MSVACNVEDPAMRRSNDAHAERRERVCAECGRRIPPERLRLLPETRTCTRCSGERKKTDTDLNVCAEGGR